MSRSTSNDKRCLTVFAKSAMNILLNLCFHLPSNYKKLYELNLSTSVQRGDILSYELENESKHVTQQMNWLQTRLLYLAIALSFSCSLCILAFLKCPSLRRIENQSSYGWHCIWHFTLITTLPGL